MKRKMNGERFFELMEHTDDDLLLRAEKYSADAAHLRMHRIIRATAIAASLCIVIAACIAVPLAMRKNKLPIDDPVISDTTDTEIAESQNNENETAEDTAEDTEENTAETAEETENSEVEPGEEWIERPATEGLIYRFLRDENAYAVSGYEGDSAEVVIPSTHNGLPVINIESSSTMNGCIIEVWGAFSGNENITDVVIQKNVKTISSYTFRGCTNLKNVKIGPDVKTIASESFINCTSLESIDIPSNVEYIGPQAFDHCEKLTNITISDSVQRIAIGAFIRTAYYNNSSNWKNGLLYVGNHLINAKSIAGTCTVREGTKTIAASAFYENVNMTEVNLPESLVYINDGAFSLCKSLESVDIPSGVLEIGSSAFSRCVDLKIVNISDTVKKIGYSAFSSCESLESVVIPGSVESIGNNLFFNCTSLKNIVLPDSLTNIGWDILDNTAYYNDASNWQGGILYVDNHLIEANDSVARNVVVKDGTKSIADRAFWENKRILSIQLPESLKTISDQAFIRCYRLAEIYNFSSLDIVKGSEKYGNIAKLAKKVYTSNASSSIVYNDDYILYSNEADDEYGIIEYIGDESIVVLPQDINGHNYEIYDVAFYQLSGITGITIPDGVTAIGESAFANCENLASITITDNIRFIGEDAFSATAYCINDANWVDNGKALYIGNHLIFVRGYGYYEEQNKEYVIRDGTKTIAGGALRSEVGLTSVIIPDGVVSIGDCAFYGNNLYEIIIPESVEYIGEYAFSYSENLKHVTIPSKVQTIKEGSFEGCYELESIVVGIGVKEIEQYAFSYNTKAMNVYYDGAQHEWSAMKISYKGTNGALQRSTVYFYSENIPVTEGKFWHYVDGVPTVW